MLVPNRHGNAGEYRYGFNGKESDGEMKGEGNSYDFGARMLDPRVGRWFARDPLEKKYPNISSYTFVVNNPMRLIDPDGRSPFDIIVKGSNNSSFTIKTSLVNSTIVLKDYGFEHDFKGNYSISTNELIPDAIGLDLSLSASACWGGTAGLNLIWHTRGEKSGDQAFPELHVYKGKSQSLNVGANANVGLILAWATKENGTMASNDFVANGVNWTGNFYSAGFTLGKGWASGGASYFTGRDPSKKASGNAWSGVQLNWSPGVQLDGGYNPSSAGTILRNLSKGNGVLKGLSFTQSYYYMMYGNGSDVLTKDTPTKKDDEDVSGWHFWNPIDPKDNK